MEFDRAGEHGARPGPACASFTDLRCGGLTVVVRDGVRDRLPADDGKRATRTIASLKARVVEVAQAPFSDDDVEAFIRRGFLPLREAFPRAVADECRAEMWG